MGAIYEAEFKSKQNICSYCNGKYVESEHVLFREKCFKLLFLQGTYF